MPTTMIRLAVTLAFLLVVFTVPTSVWAAGPTLTVSANGGVQIFDRDELLARTDVVEITTSRDVAYRTPRTYRAVALAKLFEGGAIPPDAVVEAAAQDGFVTQLPRDLVYANDGIVGYMAIEVADKPWPPIPGKDWARRRACARCCRLIIWHVERCRKGDFPVSQMAPIWNFLQPDGVLHRYRFRTLILIRWAGFDLGRRIPQRRRSSASPCWPPASPPPRSGRWPARW